MKIIFLDFDGVLNDHHHIRKVSEKEIKTQTHREDEHLDTEKVKLLNKIKKATGASVVVCSSWRILHSRHELEHILQKRGFDGIIMSMTAGPNEFTGKFRPKRWDEIKHWIENYSEKYGMTNFVVLDDSVPEDCFPGHVVQPNFFEGGLNEEQADKAIEILNS